MNNTQLFLPEKCKVGLQERQGTYTGKLGYIIYHDGKIWRKENSWEGWRHKEGDKIGYWDPETREHKKITVKGVKPIEFENVPTEGFVLNKKVGGGNSGWNNRQTYSRVYDPRGWEFEITVANLLYILQECDSFKGKGLDGEFVYAWDGKDLVLLPTSSPDYVACKAYTDLQSVKFNSRKDLFEGYTYLTNKQEELIYLGRYEVCMDTYDNKTDAEGQRDRDSRRTKLFQKRHVFIKDKQDEDDYYFRYEFLNGFSKIKTKITDEVHNDFPELVDKFLKSEYSSKADHLIVTPFLKEDMKDLRETWRYSTVYPLVKGEIRSKSAVPSKRATYNKEDKTYKVYTVSSYERNWMHSREDEHIEGILTEDELIMNYGSLKRVYKNGFIKQV